MRRFMKDMARLGCAALALSGCSASISGDPDGSPRAVEQTLSSGATPAAAPSCGARFVATAGDGGSGNTCRSPARPCATIGQAVTAACPGDGVFVGAGTFVENVVVDKALTIVGLGDRTVVVPALSSPDPCLDGSSLCGGSASSVFLVRASGVTLAWLTIDGDNPALTSGIVVGGVDVDARNGIVTDGSARFDDLTVLGVSVRNVYLRGLDASSGGTFRFEANRVSNVSNDREAIGIFNTGGAGLIEDNVVTNAAAGIASNFSRGVSFVRNRISGAGGGIHTDNPGFAAGSTADEVVDNVVADCSSGGFGAFVFVPSLPVTFRGNRVTGCAVGLAAFGEQADVQSRIVGNVIDGRDGAESTGIYVTTSQIGFGSNDVHVLVDGNRIANTAEGIFVEQETSFTATADIHCNIVDGVDGVFTESASSSLTANSITSSAIGLDASALGNAAFDAPNNWWGCPSGPGTPGCSDVTANVDVNPVATRPPACTRAAPREAIPRRSPVSFGPLAERRAALRDVVASWPIHRAQRR